MTAISGKFAGGYVGPIYYLRSRLCFLFLRILSDLHRLIFGGLDDLMESKGGKKKSSSSKSLFYEAPLGYSIEDVRPNGGIKKFRSAAYSNCVRKPS
ncbi:hypothetical protein Nepgr_017067 [Nepenthes gracilis]|uniref:Uncharacterized protein n=1 Tax=Nepenthes gracilis TaxID=150966 RepID=A0AAD3XSY6_NEPGR|nr:hypothetical protein Nepgr_017067 [Nepenthes gracilis]